MKLRSTLAVLAAALIATVSSLAAETTRTLKLELSASAGARFVVENLAGTMRVVPGAGDKVTATATIHAEDAEAAAAMEFVQVVGEEGSPTLRVVYPLSRYGKIRYPGEESDEGFGSFVSDLFGGSNTTTKYAGEKVRISTSSGTLLYADVEVQLPRHSVEAIFRNLVGKLSGENLDGKIKFDSSSGDITIKDSKGELVADTGSGDVKASNLEGSFKCDTGSGDCDLNGFRGESIECDVGSGDVSVRSVVSRRIKSGTGSGDVRVTDADVEEFLADTGSGSIELQARGSRLTRIKADTGSGDVHLRLDPEATFEALADQGSGEIQNRFRDAEPIIKNREIIGYRRGDARIRIDVDTGSGDLVLEPGT